MKTLLAFLLACAPASAANLDDARDNFDTIVRTYVSGKSVNDLWTLKSRGKKDLKLRYEKSEGDTVHSLGGGKWGGLADFTDASGKKRYYADVTVTMKGDLWNVASLKWKTGPEATALRADMKAGKATVTAEAAGPLPEILVANAAAGYDPARDTKADIKAALTEAARTNRRVLVEVGSKSCSWCDRMHKFVAEDSEVRSLKEKGYITVLADARANGPLWKEYGPVPGTPHFFVLGEDGGVIHSQNTEELEAGKSYDHDKYLAFLNDWAPAAN